MFLRKSFHEFLVLHSEAEPLPIPPPHPDPSPQDEQREPASPQRPRVIDWRWLEDRGAFR
jgi:hypothetical protein